MHSQRPSGIRHGLLGLRRARALVPALVDGAHSVAIAVSRLHLRIVKRRAHQRLRRRNPRPSPHRLRADRLHIPPRPPRCPAASSNRSQSPPPFSPGVATAASPVGTAGGNTSSASTLTGAKALRPIPASSRPPSRAPRAARGTHTSRRTGCSCPARRPSAPHLSISRFCSTGSGGGSHHAFLLSSPPAASAACAAAEPPRSSSSAVQCTTTRPCAPRLSIPPPLPAPARQHHRCHSTTPPIGPCDSSTPQNSSASRRPRRQPRRQRLAQQCPPLPAPTATVARVHAAARAFLRQTPPPHCPSSPACLCFSSAWSR